MVGWKEPRSLVYGICETFQLFNIRPALCKGLGDAIRVSASLTLRARVEYFSIVPAVHPETLKLSLASLNDSFF
jgi:hypothetical protein